MLLGGAGLTDVNVLQTNVGAFRNTDFVVNANGAFSATETIAPLAAELGHLQMFNPAASGIIVFIDRIIVSSTTTQLFFGGMFDTELTADRGAWLSQLNGGAAGLAHIRRETNIVTLAAELFGAIVLANTPFDIELEYPIQLPANSGFLVVGNTTNTDIRATFYGREV